MWAWGAGPGWSDVLFRRFRLKVKRIGRGGSGAVQLDERVVLTQVGSGEAR